MEVFLAKTTPGISNLDIWYMNYIENQKDFYIKSVAVSKFSIIVNLKAKMKLQNNVRVVN